MVRRGKVIETTELIGWVVTAIAIVGVLLNNHRMRACFVVWTVSNLLSAGLHIHAGMFALFVRDVVFCFLAAYGYWYWGRAKKP